MARNDSVFLDSSVFMTRAQDLAEKLKLKEDVIRFEFPQGFTDIPLIEECRALQALDISEPENFDLMYDIMMQMLVGKPVIILYDDPMKGRQEIEKFVVTGRYMNLRGVTVIDAYPVIVTWLVEMISAYLGKKFPRSLNDIQATKSEREERMNQNQSL